MTFNKRDVSQALFFILLATGIVGTAIVANLAALDNAMDILRYILRSRISIWTCGLVLLFLALASLFLFLAVAAKNGDRIQSSYSGTSYDTADDSGKISG